jgi:hypothetical protein
MHVCKENVLYPLCTGVFLYVRYCFLLISNKFCDLILLHWPLLRAVSRCGRGGGQWGAQEALNDTAL